MKYQSLACLAKKKKKMDLPSYGQVQLKHIDNADGNVKWDKNFRKLFNGFSYS